MLPDYISPEEIEALKEKARQERLLRRDMLIWLLLAVIASLLLIVQ